VDGVSTRPVHLDPALAKAVERARTVLEASGQLRRRPGVLESPLGKKEQAAVARILRDGTYRRWADAVARDDPELADL
jgi:hypothetical protein